MKLPPLILASASPRRADLLRQLGLKFRVAPAASEEVIPAFLSPHETAQVNARRKAEAVARRYPRALILSADTLVCLGAVRLGKPQDLAEARRMLRRLQGRAHEVVTGVCLFRLRPRRELHWVESTEVVFRALTLRQIAEYLARIDPLDKAGAYAIQEHGDLIVERIEGSYSNVVGLPLERVRQMLARWAGAAGKQETET